MKHNHRWVKVYRYDGKSFRVAGLWVKVGRGRYTEHNAKVCLDCGQVNLKDINSAKEVIDAKN